MIHGRADSIVSVDVTVARYPALDDNRQRQPTAIAHFFRVPGLGHSRGGDASAPCDGPGALVSWVEQGDVASASRFACER